MPWGVDVLLHLKGAPLGVSGIFDRGFHGDFVRMSWDILGDGKYMVDLWYPRFFLGGYFMMG